VSTDLNVCVKADKVSTDLKVCVEADKVTSVWVVNEVKNGGHDRLVDARVLGTVEDLAQQHANTPTVGNQVWV